MAIQESTVPVHWNYFLSLESDILNLSRYIEFTELNFDSFSIEQARILLSSSSEVDVVAKLLCNRVDHNSNPTNITEYQQILTNSLEQFTIPEIYSIVVKIPRYGLSFQPWDNWQVDNNSPLWWKAHNKVKHERNINFYQANLKNTLNSVAGLFVLLIVYYRILTNDGVYSIDKKTFSPPTLFRDFYIFYGD